MDDLLNLSNPVLVALALNAVGWVIKQSKIEDRFIPLALCLFGALGYAALLGFTPRNLLLGLVIGAGSTGFNQLYRQQFTTKGKDEKDSPISDSDKS